MIEIKKVDLDFWECNNCQKSGKESEIYTVSLVRDSLQGSNSSSFRLCADCLKELSDKAIEMTKS